MAGYINGIGIISPQPTVESTEFLPEVREYTADYLRCIEPTAYRPYIDPILARRMSRLIKMGIVSARISLTESGCEMPDAIITGTGLGSVDDTEKILGEITKDEKFLNPTPFIQSTYNTISSQVAIHLKCHGYNSTYVHRTFSFESALTDALLQLDEGIADNILAGGIDEMTPNHLLITRRIGQWKQEPVHNLSIFESETPGALAGEGAAFFTLGREKGTHSWAVLADVATEFTPGIQPDLGAVTDRFLSRNGLVRNEIDLLVLGFNGDSANDPFYSQFATQLFPGVAVARYKHLCGEYHTATGFGLYAAAGILKHQTYPAILQASANKPGRFRNILIYNHFRNTNHTFLLVRQA